MPSTKAEKVRENRLRRAAARRGMLLQRSRRRDHKAIDFDLYSLSDAQTKILVHRPGPFGPFVLTLDEVEELLEEG